MRSALATIRSHPHAEMSTGQLRLASKDPQKPNRALRSLDKYFWYTSSDAVSRLVTSCGALGNPPEQINDYVFNASIFADCDHPSTLPESGAWPPAVLQDLLCPIGEEGEDCVGDRCYTSIICENPRCRHTFENWKIATQGWQEHFELRKTNGRGVGVYTRRAFKKEDVLGWYAGELVASNGDSCDNDYLMEMPIGNVPAPGGSSVSGSDIDSDQARTPSPTTSCSSSQAASASREETVAIDGSTKGTWTRFINHSCEPHSMFCLRRVGNIRIMVVEAIRDIPADVELTVSYGLDYYGPYTKKICYCGTQNCVRRFRNNREKEL